MLPLKIQELHHVYIFTQIGRQTYIADIEKKKSQQKINQSFLNPQYKTKSIESQFCPYMEHMMPNLRFRVSYLLILLLLLHVVFFQGKVSIEVAVMGFAQNIKLFELASANVKLLPIKLNHAYK